MVDFYIPYFFLKTAYTFYYLYASQFVAFLVLHARQYLYIIVSYKGDFHMNRDTLKQIMIDQKESYLNNPLIPRKYFLEENVNYCFVGIRRTGKSYMMYQKIQSLIEKGVPVSQIVYVNFEDERLLEITSDDLNIILEIGIELSGTANRPYLFFDEIQNIDGWEKFVRRMADMKYRIDITGSNSKMLSNEIASTLGGRFVILNVYPYSFSEYPCC